MVHKCWNCGKAFLVYGEQWEYAVGRKMTCSYHCMRELEAKETDGVMTKEEMRSIDTMAAAGKTSGEIAEQLGMTRKQVYNYIWRTKNSKEAKQEKKPEQKPEQHGGVEKPKAKAAAPQDSDRTTALRLLDRVVRIIEKIYGMEEE